MATTVFFEKTIRDKKDKSDGIEFEFGRSSFYGENLMYFSINSKTVIVDEKTGREIYEQISALGRYLGYDE